MGLTLVMTDDRPDSLDMDVERAYEGRAEDTYDLLAREARRDAVRRAKKKRQSLALAVASFLMMHLALWTNSWQDSHRLDLVALAWSVALAVLAVIVYPRKD
jgi:hypothetical protein